MSVQHSAQIRQFLDTKLQNIFSQVRDEYDQQCETLLKSMERDVTQMNSILQEFNTKFENSILITSIHESMSNLVKQSQRVDVIRKNLEFDWQILRQTGSIRFDSIEKMFLKSFLLAEQFDGETVLLAAPVALPKSDAAVKQELGMKFDRSTENKENHFETSRPVAMPCRLKNDVSSVFLFFNFDFSLVFFRRPFSDRSIGDVFSPSLFFISI